MRRCKQDLTRATPLVATFAPLLVNRPNLAEDLALSLARRAQQAQTGTTPGPQQERSMRAFLRAIQTSFHR